MGQYKVYSEEEKRWITLPMAFQGEQGVKGEPGDDGVTPMFKIVNGMWNISYDNGRTWGEVGPANGTSINDVQAIVDSSTGTPSASASYSGPDNARTLTFRFSGLKGEQGPAGKDGVAGADGKDGIDGSAYEYIYFRGFSAEHKPNRPASGVGNAVDDFVPTEKQNVSVNGSTYELKWSDKAQGVDAIYMFEWRSERNKLDANTWSDFTNPILWAKYGEKGKDGDGVQYIFKLTSGDTPDNPTPTDWETNSKYQNNETEEFIPTGWDDDPQQVTEVNTHCWVSVRKYRNDKWLGYSNPTLWSKYVADFNGVVADSIVIEMDPDMVMVNEDENTAKTTIRAYRGNDTINIAKIEVVEDGGCTIKTPEEKEDFSWDVEITNIDSNSSIVSIKLAIYMSNEEGAKPRYKTFRIYQTKYDAETATLNFDDDNVLIPCPDGNTPAEGFFDNFTIPVAFRIGGVNQSNFTLTADTSDNNWFELSSDKANLAIKAFPGTDKTANVQFTATSGQTSATASIRFTKFDTKGGTISMYSLRADSNKIVCDTRGADGNKYTVYSGKTEAPNNTIKAIVSCYSTDGNKQVSIASLPSNYAVFYCIDPQDYHENTSSTYGEYVRLTDAGIKIGGEGANSELELNPDTCVSFQLREWIDKEKEPWSVVNEECYTVWDTENILVDIIRDIAAYKFVFTPDKIHIKHDKTLSTDKIVFGMSKNKAGDGDPTYEVLKEIPTGYDVYYSFDDGLSWNKIGGEGETDDLPAEINLLDESGEALVDQHILVKMVINENDGSLDDDAIGENNITVLSETIEVTSEIPGKSAYVGYLTDPMGVVSCDAANKPVGGTVLSTIAKVTNGTVTNVTVCSDDGNTLENSVNFTYTVDKDTVTFTNFQDTLPDVTKLILKVKYKDSEGIELKEGDDLGYTIVKLSIAEASTILDFTNDNIVIPFDSNGERLTDSVTTKVVMMHGGEWLTIEGLVNPDQNGYHDLTIDLTELMWKDGVASYTKTFKGYSEKLKDYFELTGQILFSKGVAGKSGKVFDLVLAGNSPIFKADIDKFDDDYIEGWVLVWDADGKATVATYGEIVSAGYQIRYIEANGTGNEAMLQEIDFDDNNHFKIYINADAKQDQGNDNLAYADIDSTNGLNIYFVDSDGIRIRGEQVKVVFDERDFGKFELMMSDESINCVTHSDESHEVIPNEISLLGFYEHIGSNKTQITDSNNIRTHHVAGLDVYYGYDTEVDVLNPNLNDPKLHSLTDTKNDGYVTNDTIQVTYDEAQSAEKLNIYLIAHYNDPSISGNDESYRVVDQKEIRIYRTSDGKDADPVQSLVEYSLKANHTYITSDMNVDEIKISVIAKTLGVESSVEELIEIPSDYSLKYYLNGNDQDNTNELTYSTNSMTHGDVLEVKLLDPASKLIDLVIIEYIETIESRITVVNDNHTDQIYLDGDNKPIDIDKFANDLLAWGSFINVYQGNKSIEFSSEDTDLPIVKNMVWEFYNEEESCVSTQESHKFKDNEGNHQNDITGLSYNMTVAYSKSNKMHLMYHLWKNYFDAEFDWSEISYILIKTDILYKGDTYPIITKLVVTSGSDDIDLYVSPLMYAYKNGMCKGWYGDEDSVYVRLYLNNKQVWMEDVSEIPEGYALRYGFVVENGDVYSKTYNCTDSEYAYLKFSETGGKTNPYVRFVEFGKIDSDDSFDVLDRQEIRPLLDGTPAQHLEIDNNFQLIYVDKDSNASTTQLIEANVFLVEGGKKVDNASITKETSIGEFSGGKFTYTISQGDSCKELPTKITFKCNDLIANLHINTTLSPGDIEDLIDDKVNDLEVNGARGRMLYPAGVWKSDVEYEVTKNAAPYVEFTLTDDKTINNKTHLAGEKMYFILSEGSSTNQSPQTSDIWEPMETFSSVFTEAIVAPYGNIGGAVYYSHTTSDGRTYEFLFSKSGKANNGVNSAEYSDFMIDVEPDAEGENKAVDWEDEQELLDVILEKSRFIPNTLICFTTGEAWYSGGSTKFYADSSSVAGIEYVDELAHYYPESITLVLDQESTEDGIIELTFEDGGFDADGKFRYASVKSNSNSNIDVYGHHKGAQEWNNTADSISFKNLVLICDVSEIKNEPGEILFSEAFVSYQSDNRTFETPKCYIRYVENNTDNGIDYNVYDYITLPLKWADEQDISGTKDVKFQSLYMKCSETSGDMHVSGDLTVNKTLYYQDIQELSDERKKTFENSINVDFDKLASLRKSYFTYNDKPSVQKIGVSAQEIQKLYPEIVGTDPRGYLGVDYSKLSVIALKAIDQLHERVKYLEGVIESLSK